jgi:hypothetical protein
MRWSCYRARRPASRQRGCIRSRLHKLNKLLNQQKGVRRIAPAQRLATQGKGSVTLSVDMFPKDLMSYL